MLLSEIRDWLKTKTDCPNWYIGKIDGSKERCIGIYSVPGPPPTLAVGGLANTGYATKSISILVHWGQNADVAERKAKEVYNCMFGNKATIGNKRVVMFNMRTSDPIGVGTDNQNIYEYVIEVNIIHER